tara:strand:+ start:1162 stop:1263 length:102 start_codon:yes stop_codon:yes gene_type:complete
MERVVVISKKMKAGSSWQNSKSEPLSGYAFGVN